MDRWTSRIALGGMLLIGLSAAAAAQEHADLKRGDAAPSFRLRTIGGETVELSSLRGDAVVLLFAEPEHTRVELAIEDISRVLADASLADQPVKWVIALSQTSDPEALDLDQGIAPLPIITRDEKRATFGAFGVFVLPSLAVLDRQGRVALVKPGWNSRAPDRVRAALRYALGHISERQFDQLLELEPAAPPTESEQKAQRLLQLADRLVGRGMTAMAESQYGDVLELEPDLVAARVGLGQLMLADGRPEAAREHFEHALAVDTGSSRAAIGLAECLLESDALATDQAEVLTRRVLAREPNSARAHFLQGLIHERRGEGEPALRAYKRAAAILLRHAYEDSPDGDRPDT